MDDIITNGRKVGGSKALQSKGCATFERYLELLTTAATQPLGVGQLGGGGDYIAVAVPGLPCKALGREV